METLRRTLHDRPRRAERRNARRTRELPRTCLSSYLDVVEQRAPVTPPAAPAAGSARAGRRGAPAPAQARVVRSPARRSSRRCDRRRDPRQRRRRRSRTPVCPPKPFRIVFPEGFTREQMADRITAVDADRAAASATMQPRLVRSGVPRRPRASSKIRGVRRLRRDAAPATRASSSRRPTTSCTNTTSQQLGEDQLDAFQRELGAGRTCATRSRRT